MKPKLLLVTRNYPYQSNGGETMFVKPEIPYLVKHFDVTVAPVLSDGELVDDTSVFTLDQSLSESFKSDRDGFNKVILGLRALFSKALYREIFRSIKHGKLPDMKRILGYCLFYISVYDWLKSIKSDYDLYYTYWSNAATSGIVKLLEKKDKKIITRVHGLDVYHERQGGYIPGYEYNFSGVSKIVTISEHGKNYLISQGIPSSRIILSRLGVKSQKESSKTGDRDTLYVLSCSFVKPLKRVASVYEALTKVAKNCSNLSIEWTHLGSGQLLSNLKEQVKSSCPDNLVCNFPGYIPNEEVIYYYKKNPVDLFVHASETEGLPVSMQEALSFGVPIISTDVGGVSEIVVPEVGILVEPENPSENLACAILEYLQYDKELVLDKRNRAQNRQRKLFNSDKNHGMFANKLKEMIN